MKLTHVNFTLTDNFMQRKIPSNFQQAIEFMKLLQMLNFLNLLKTLNWEQFFREYLRLIAILIKVFQVDEFEFEAFYF